MPVSNDKRSVRARPAAEGARAPRAASPAPGDAPQTSAPLENRRSSSSSVFGAFKRDPLGAAAKALLFAAPFGLAAARPAPASSALASTSTGVALLGNGTEALAARGGEPRAPFEQIVLPSLRQPAFMAALFDDGNLPDVPDGTCESGVYATTMIKSGMGNMSARIMPRPGGTLAERLIELAGESDIGEVEPTFSTLAAGEFEAALEVLRKAPKVADVWKMTPDVRKALSTVIHEFGKQQVEPHVAWHSFGGRHRSGGEEGAGSGELFFGFHRMMLAALEAKVGEGFKLPEWNPGTAVPPELTAQTGQPRTRNPQVPVRGFLTIDGGNPWSNPWDRSGKQYRSLHDFTTPDELAQAIGLSGYHGSTHVMIGGVMATFRSPLDDAFYLWHGHIDHILDEWLTKTANGKKWAAEHPNDPLLDMKTDIKVFDSNESLAAERARRGAPKLELW